MDSRYVAYRKRRRVEAQEEIQELKEVNASLVKKVYELEEQNFRLSQSLKERLLGYVPKKPKKEKQLSRSKKEEIHRILMKR
jgi:hypothetical protein